MYLKSLAIVVRTKEKGLRSILYTIRHNCEYLDDVAVLSKAGIKLADDLKVGEELVSINFLNEEEV